MNERFAGALKNGILVSNPTFVQLLGMCPLLAMSTTMINAIGMGLATTLVLISSNFVISLFRKAIPNKIRIPAYIAIIGCFVTAVDMLLQAYFPSLSATLGLFVPLIVVNCIVLARAESFACLNSPLSSALDGLSMGCGFTFALVSLALIREVLGSGTFFGIKIFGGGVPLSVLALPSGGFLALGCIVAFVQYLKDRNDKKGGDD